MSKLCHGWAMANLEARISAHVHAWEKLRESGQPLAAEEYPFITVSRQFGCEGLDLACRLAEILNERCRPTFTWVPYHDEILRKVADEMHLHRSVVETIDGQRRTEMGELFDSILNRHVDESLIFRKIAEVVRSLAIHGHTILVGRGSYLITQDLRNGLHVRLVAPRDWRIHKVADERQISLKEAARIVEEGEAARERYLRTFFVHDPEHPFYHDLVIDNSRFNLAQIAEIVFTALSVRFGPRLVGA